jgi:hypothetical protein
MLFASFRQRYETSENDPYNGFYGDVLAEFVVSDKHWNGTDVATQIVEMDAEVANAYIGLFPDDDYPTGTTRLLHSPRRFAAKLGRPSKYDGDCFAILDDAIGGTVQAVEFKEEFFECTGKINLPADSQAALKLWGDEPEAELLLAPKHHKETVRVVKMMYVPAKFISLFIGKRFTPRQLMEDVYPVLAEDSDLDELKPFIQWLMACGMSGGQERVASPVLLPDLKAPVADASFLEWIKSFLDKTVPGRNEERAAPLAEAANQQAANVVAQMLQEQQLLMGNRASAKGVKTVSDYFKPQLATKLMILCGVEIETDLPEIWSDLAANGGKRDRDLIEISFRNTAAELGMADLTPVVTPSLAKKITGLRFVGADLDNLNEGINPFSIVIVDHSTTNGEAAYQAAMESALDYDDLMSGTGVSLTDLKAVKSTNAVTPEAPGLARAMIKSFHILLVSLLGDDHPLVRRYWTFVTTLDQKENFYFDRLQKADGRYGPARLLRFLHLHIRAWFSEVWNATDHETARAVPFPPFHKPLRMMGVDDMTWLPILPQQRIKHPLPMTARQQDTKRQKSGQSQSAQVVNPKRNKRFEDFRTNIATTKFNDAINKVGPPPSIQRNGKETQMCASYHLRGTCRSSCPRAADHTSHSPEEDQQLYSWCTQAFE